MDKLPCLLGYAGLPLGKKGRKAEALGGQHWRCSDGEAHDTNGQPGDVTQLPAPHCYTWPQLSERKRENERAREREKRGKPQTAGDAPAGGSRIDFILVRQ